MEVFGFEIIKIRKIRIIINIIITIIGIIIKIITIRISIIIKRKRRINKTI